MIRIKGNEGYIWEVKRNTIKITRAIAQLKNYVENGKYHHNPNLKLKIGDYYITGRSLLVSTVTSDYYVQYWNAGSGIIYYNYRKALNWERIGNSLKIVLLTGVVIMGTIVSGGTAGALAFV